MTPNEHEKHRTPSSQTSPAPTAAPLLAAIEREIQERCQALDDLETAWLEALMARSFGLARWLADCSMVHCAEIALARAELERYGGPSAGPDSC